MEPYLSLPRSSSFPSKTEAPRQNQARAYFQVTVDTCGRQRGLASQVAPSEEGPRVCRPVGLSFQASLNKKRKGAELPHTLTGLRRGPPGASIPKCSVQVPGPTAAFASWGLSPDSLRGVSNLATQSLVTSLDSTDSLFF